MNRATKKINNNSMKYYLSFVYIGGNMKKIKEAIKNNKYNILIFVGMLIFTGVICINFIKPHLALDTYCVYSYSNQELISHFLVSNRIFR